MDVVTLFVFSGEPLVKGYMPLYGVQFHVNHVQVSVSGYSVLEATSNFKLHALKDIVICQSFVYI